MPERELPRSQISKAFPARREGFVPKTGFEPARRFQRYHLKVVRLPISPPGQQGDKIREIIHTVNTRMRQIISGLPRTGNLYSPLKDDI